MSYIYSWVKNLVCFYILLTVVLHLLPKQNYQKYVRFFSGILLTILVISPILSLLGNEEAIREKINQAEFFQGLDNLKLDTAHLEDQQKELYREEYERALGMDVSRMAEDKQLLPRQVKVQLSEDYEVESIEMTVSLGEDEIFLTDFEENRKEEQKINELKQELMEFYRLTKGQVSIGIVLGDGGQG